MRGAKVAASVDGDLVDNYGKWQRCLLWGAPPCKESFGGWGCKAFGPKPCLQYETEAEAAQPHPGDARYQTATQAAKPDLSETKNTERDGATGHPDVTPPTTTAATAEPELDHDMPSTTRHVYKWRRCLEWGAPPCVEFFGGWQCRRFGPRPCNRYETDEEAAQPHPGDARYR